MAVKAVAAINNVFTTVSFPSTTPSTFTAVIQYAGLDSTNPVEDSVYVENIAANVIQATFQGAIAAAVKAHLTANHGYSFGLFDTVTVVGGNLLGL